MEGYHIIPTLILNKQIYCICTITISFFHSIEMFLFTCQPTIFSVILMANFVYFAEVSCDPITLPPLITATPSECGNLSQPLHQSCILDCPDGYALQVGYIIRKIYRIKHN